MTTTRSRTTTDKGTHHQPRPEPSPAQPSTGLLGLAVPNHPTAPLGVGGWLGTAKPPPTPVPPRIPAGLGPPTTRGTQREGHPPRGRAVTATEASGASCFLPVHVAARPLLPHAGGCRSCSTWPRDPARQRRTAGAEAPARVTPHRVLAARSLRRRSVLRVGRWRPRQRPVRRGAEASRRRSYGRPTSARARCPASRRPWRSCCAPSPGSGR